MNKRKFISRLGVFLLSAQLLSPVVFAEGNEERQEGSTVVLNQLVSEEAEPLIDQTIESTTSTDVSITEESEETTFVVPEESIQNPETPEVTVYDQEAIESEAPEVTERSAEEAIAVQTAQVESRAAVTIPDANLAAAIKKQLNVTTITTEALQKLVNLSIEESVSSLEGLQHATNLQLLSIYGGGTISDISPLKNLSKLTMVNLQNQNISDIAALANKPNLASLFLSNNKISNISVLSTMTKLTTLQLTGNAISDISVLLKLPVLKSASVYDQKLSEVGATDTNLFTSSVKIVAGTEKISFSRDTSNEKALVFDHDGTYTTWKYSKVEEGTTTAVTTWLLMKSTGLGGNIHFGGKLSSEITFNVATEESSTEESSLSTEESSVEESESNAEETNSTEESSTSTEESSRTEESSSSSEESSSAEESSTSPEESSGTEESSSVVTTGLPNQSNNSNGFTQTYKATGKHLPNTNSSTGTVISMFGGLLLVASSYLFKKKKEADTMSR